MTITPETMTEARELLMPRPTKDLIGKLRYMGRQYASGQHARGGGFQKHYLEEAADELERLFAQTVELGSEVADLRSVVQAACTSGGLDAMAKAWAKYFPDHLITVSTLGVEPTDGSKLDGNRENNDGR